MKFLRNILHQVLHARMDHITTYSHHHFNISGMGGLLVICEKKDF